MDELDRADVDAARRLPHEYDGGISLDLAREYDLLLVAAREIGGLEQRGAGTDVVGLHLPRLVRDDRLAVEQHALAVQGFVLEAEHRALASLERHHEAYAVAILGHVTDAECAHALGIRFRGGRELAIHEVSARRGQANARKRLQQLGLTVAGNAGDADDLALAQHE